MEYHCVGYDYLVVYWCMICCFGALMHHSQLLFPVILNILRWRHTKRLSEVV